MNVNKLPDKVFNALPQEVQKYIFKLQTNIFSLNQQYECLKKEYENMMNKKRIVSEIKYLKSTVNDSSIQMKWYEEGQIEAYRKVIGFKEEDDVNV